MAIGRGNAAENLGDVLALVRLRKQSGTLRVERFQGGRFEEGEIYLQAGQPTHARTGQMAGQEALTRMLSWRQVFFSLSNEEPRTPASVSSAPSTNRNSAFPAPSLPTNYQLPNTTGGNLPNPSSRPPQARSKSASAQENAFDGLYALADPKNPPGTPGLESLVPQKLGADRDVLSLPLTRPQRSIYMLVDGHRTVSDLSRCTRKSLQEIERLLSELRERGLISV